MLVICRIANWAIVDVMARSIEVVTTVTAGKVEVTGEAVAMMGG